MKRDGQWAVGSFRVPLSGLGPLVVTVQPTWTDGTKKKRLACPDVVRISLGAAPAAADDGRTFWRYVDAKKGEGWFIKTAAGWDEEDDGATHHFVEAARDNDKIELFDAKRNIRLQLQHDRLLIKMPKKKGWGRLYAGAWEATGDVVAAK
jgi:hypothetical protein